MAETFNLLDFDGTVVDDMAALSALGAYTIHKHFGARLEVARQMYWDTVGRPFKQQLIMLGYSTADSAKAAKEYEGAKIGLTLGSPPTSWFAKFILPTDVKVTIVSSTIPTLLQDWFDAWYPSLSKFEVQVVQRPKVEYIGMVGTYPGRANFTFYGDTDYDEELADHAGIKFMRVK